MSLDNVSLERVHIPYGGIFSLNLLFGPLKIVVHKSRAPSEKLQIDPVNLARAIELNRIYQPQSAQRGQRVRVGMESESDGWTD